MRRVHLVYWHGGDIHTACDLQRFDETTPTTYDTERVTCADCRKIVDEKRVLTPNVNGARLFAK